MISETVLFYGSAILSGIILSIIVKRVPMKKKKQEQTISEVHIQECIGLSPDGGKNIDDVVGNLRKSNIDPHFSVE